MRNRKQTEEIILTAVDSLMLKGGFGGIGINAIAREADLSKVLIYRYFGNIEGLMEAWALKNSYWIESASELDPELPVKETVKDVFKSYTGSLRSNPVKREVLKWLLVRENPACKKVMEKIEESGLQLTGIYQSHKDAVTNLDTEALFAVLTAGVSYLTLMSDRANVFNGVRLDTEEGWKRIENSINCIIDRTMEGGTDE